MHQAGQNEVKTDECPAASPAQINNPSNGRILVVIQKPASRRPALTLRRDEGPPAPSGTHTCRSSILTVSYRTAGMAGFG